MPGQTTVPVSPIESADNAHLSLLERSCVKREDDVCAVFAPEQEALCNDNFALHNRRSSGAKNAQNAKLISKLESAND